MGRTKSDISNSAIRIFLQDVGKYYDEARGFEPFVPKIKQKEELLSYFNNQCCFCGAKINSKSLSQDHLIPMKKASLGLHAWGNVVPCCKACNNEKQQKPWTDFIIQKAGDKTTYRIKVVKDFVKSEKYDPTLNLHQIADNLYEDVGQVAMTLIRLRFNQAQNQIKALFNYNK